MKLKYENNGNFELDFINDIIEEHSLQADIRSTICLLQSYSVDLIKENNDFDKTKEDIRKAIVSLLHKLKI